MYRSLKETLPLGLTYEIIFVDDASTDGTRAWLAGLSEQNIKIIFNHSTVGYAKANNSAITIARGQIIGLLNNDLVFKPHWLEPMLEVLESPVLKAGIVGNVQERFVDGVLDHLGVELSLQANFEHIKQPPRCGSNNFSKTIAVTGACCLIHKETLNRVHGLSEEFLNGCEDIDLCLKIAQLGLHSYVSLDSTVKHHVSLTRGINSLQNETNSVTLQKKWRTVLGHELSTRWRKVLSEQSSTALQEFFDGHFSADIFLLSEATSALIAENMLSRNEHLWARSLQQKDTNGDAGIQMTCTGLSSEPNSEYFVASEVIRLTFKGLRNARNFCAFGHRVESAKQSRCRITVSVNNLHRKSFDVTNDRSFVLNFDAPLLLPQGDNHFKICIEQTPNEADSDGYSATASPVLITHFMLDKRFVYISEPLTP